MTRAADAPDRLSPATVTVPLSRRDVPAPPLLVKIGDDVTIGQRLADPTDDTGPAVLAPVSGRLTGTIQATLAGAGIVPAVQIQVADPSAVFTGEPPTPPSDLAVLFNQLRDAGLWAHRQSGPDLLAQIHHAIRRPCDTLIVHGLDGDPRARVNAPVLADDAEDVAAAIEALVRVTHVTQRWLITESGASLPDAAARTLRGAPVRLMRIDHRYPQGDPTLLLYTLLKRRLRPGRLPTEQGVLLLDAPGAAAVGRWLRRGEPMCDLPVAVHDARTRRVWRGRVPVGSAIADVLRLAGADPAELVRCGDALRDVRSGGDTIVAGGELLFHVGYADPSADPEACIRCGWCVQGCPTRIHPAGLLEAAQTHDTSMAERYGIEACIECGICSYVCPAKLPLLGAIRSLRDRGVR